MTQEGFANRHNLNPASFLEHIDQYGKLKAAGKVLMKHAKGEEFANITYEHLEAWQALYKSRNNKITAGDFAEKNNLNPVLWGTYVDETGALKQSGKNLIILGEPTPRPHLARKGSARRDTSEGTKRPAEESLPGNSKRPRPDPEAAPAPCLQTRSHRCGAPLRIRRHRRPLTKRQLRGSKPVSRWVLL